MTGVTLRPAAVSVSRHSAWRFSSGARHATWCTEPMDSSPAGPSGDSTRSRIESGPPACLETGPPSVLRLLTKAHRLGQKIDRGLSLGHGERHRVEAADRVLVGHWTFGPRS